MEYPGGSSPHGEPVADLPVRPVISSAGSSGSSSLDRLAFTLSAAVFLFFTEALRALFGALFAGFYDGLFPTLQKLVLRTGLAPAVAVFVPALPLKRWLERDRVAVYSAATAAVLRVGLCLPQLSVRSVFSAALIVCCAVFILAATGSFSRRVHAAGAATGLVLDQILRLFGRSYDLTLRPQWWVAQLVVAAVIVVVALRYLGHPQRLSPTAGEDRLERRGGGLRLRGAIGIACILFLESSVLGMPEVAARLTGVSYESVGLVMVLAGMAAIAVILASRGPIGRHRPGAAVLSVMATLAAAAPFGFDGWPVAMLVAAGHFAVLVLIYRTLAPAGGRRGGWVLSVGLATLICFQIIYGLTFFYGFTIRGFQDRAPWLMTLVGTMLALAMVLTPRPNESRSRRIPWPAYALAGVAILALMLRLSWRAAPAPVPTNSASTLRVATYNVHYGFDGAWRYDPEAIARALESVAADVIALQEVPVGMPAAYGTDLVLWLGRRLRMESYFAPSINGLLGDAFLTRLPVLAFDALPLPPDSVDRKQLLRLTVRTRQTIITAFGLHLGVNADERRAQSTAAIQLIGQTPNAILAGDLNDQPGSETLARFTAAGFNNAFHVLGLAQPMTAPALQPREAIDYVLVRGIDVDAASVLPLSASDHLPVLAVLRLR
ncbi:MAG: endonuclease/exonuclease/phosphatase family protein [Longimicrobiales bacterium]